MSKRVIWAAAAVLYKNHIKRTWANDEEVTWRPEDRTALKSQVVPTMIALASQPNLQSQVGEAIALMAETDFPHEWGQLVDVRLQYAWLTRSSSMG